MYTYIRIWGSKLYTVDPSAFSAIIGKGTHVFMFICLSTIRKSRITKNDCVYIRIYVIIYIYILGSKLYTVDPSAFSAIIGKGRYICICTYMSAI
jgi:hypothetical protein